MKVNKLIEELQKCNPDDEVICGGGGPIYFLESKPGYYDGHTPMLIQDESKSPYYNIVGYKYDSKIGKVVLQAMDLKSCLYDCETIADVENFVVECDSRYLAHTEQTKKEVIDFINELNKGKA